MWLGRSIARETHDLSEVAVAHADRLICAVPAKIGQVRARRLIDEARLYHDPDRALEDERQGLAERHVTLSHTTCPATQGLHLMLDRADAERFDHTIAQIATKLSALGDDDGLDVRRARAVGILADPQHTLDLLARPVADRSDPFTAAREAVTGIGPKSFSGPSTAPAPPAAVPLSSTCTSHPTTWPSTSRPAPGPQSSNGSGRPASSWSRPGWRDASSSSGRSWT